MTTHKTDWATNDNVPASVLNAWATDLNTANAKLGAHVGVYDPARNVYNWKAANTQKLRAALGKAATGTLQHFYVIGDSISAGYMGTGASPTSDPLKAWPRVMRSTLATLGIPVGGTGLVPTSDGQNTGFDSRWTVNSGTWSIYPYGYLYTSSSGGQLTFLSDTAGTQVDVYYYGLGGAFTVNIDGLGAVTPTAGGSTVPMKYTVTGLANTTHSVVITASNTTARYIIGASVTAASGLVVDNIAISGMTSTTWLPGLFIGPNDTFVGALTTSSITPAAVFVELGPNDAIGGASSATFKSNITALRTQFSSSDFVLIGHPCSNAYLSDQYDLADTLNLPLIDVFDRHGGTLTGGPAQLNGLVTDSGQLHPNKAFHADWGRNIAQLVAS